MLAEAFRCLQCSVCSTLLVPNPLGLRAEPVLSYQQLPLRGTLNLRQEETSYSKISIIFNARYGISHAALHLCYAQRQGT